MLVTTDSLLSAAHDLNIGLHVGCGAIAMALGLVLLRRAKGTPAHARLGRWYVGFTALVCLFATVGLVAFRFLPMFAVLTVLVLYQLLSGWHAVRTREAGPDRLDALLAAAALGACVVIVPALLGAGARDRSVLLATSGALVALLAYDVARWIFPVAWHARLWPYEHVYKMLGSLFGMLSALVGNVVRVGQPWSQLVPSAIGLAVVVYFFRRLSTTDRGGQNARSRRPLRERVEPAGTSASSVTSGAPDRRRST